MTELLLCKKADCVVNAVWYSTQPTHLNLSFKVSIQNDTTISKDCNTTNRKDNTDIKTNNQYPY